MLIVIATAFLLPLVPTYVETTIPVDSYVVEIDGLSGCAVNGTATIMVQISFKLKYRSGAGIKHLVTEDT